jgi:Predicted membrane protein (DUF2306)
MGTHGQMLPAVDSRATAQSALRASALLWFVPALVGQAFFAYHIAAAYIATALAGNIAAWNKVLFVGFVVGDHAGNIALVAHLFISFVITISGMLQLVPQIRSFAPVFHRWNGRIYIAIALMTSLAALYMIWTRNTFGGILINKISVSIDALLIILFAGIALRQAVARKIDVHRRWALRTFMVVSGVWFTRVIYAFLNAMPGEPPGVADDMTGLTNIAIGFVSYLLPLAVLELYFLARRSVGLLRAYLTSALLLAATAATSIGAYGTITRWLK